MSGLYLDLVTSGWDLPGWDQTFYPEDLPRDWRLTYFANEFWAVLIPAAAWLQADASLLRSWSEDVHDRFRFYLEDPGTQAAGRALAQAIAIIGPKLAGTLVPPGSPGRWAQAPARFRLLGEPGPPPDTDCLPAWQIPPLLIGQLRAARDWLQSLSATTPAARGLLVFPNDTPDASDLRCWWDLIRLLGMSVA